MLRKSNVNFSLEIYAPTSQNSPNHLPYTSVPLRDMCDVPCICPHAPRRGKQVKAEEEYHGPR